MVDLEEQKKRVEIQKKKIQVRERFLREKERQRKFKRISEIVEVAFEACLDQIEDVVLLGAFLEIAEKMQDPEVMDVWKNRGEEQVQKKGEKPEQLLAVSFNSEPGKELKAMLKKMKFRWNPFRKEFCGYGSQRELEALLKEADCSVEIIP